MTLAKRRDRSRRRRDDRGRRRSCCCSTCRSEGGARRRGSPALLAPPSNSGRRRPGKDYDCDALSDCHYANISAKRRRLSPRPAPQAMEAASAGWGTLRQVGETRCSGRSPIGSSRQQGKVCWSKIPVVLSWCGSQSKLGQDDVSSNAKHRPTSLRRFAWRSGLARRPKPPEIGLEAAALRRMSAQNCALWRHL